MIDNIAVYSGERVAIKYMDMPVIGSHFSLQQRVHNNNFLQPTWRRYCDSILSTITWCHIKLFWTPPTEMRCQHRTYPQSQRKRHSRTKFKAKLTKNNVNLLHYMQFLFYSTDHVAGRLEVWFCLTTKIVEIIIISLSYTVYMYAVNPFNGYSYTRAFGYDTPWSQDLVVGSIALAKRNILAIPTLRSHSLSTFASVLAKSLKVWLLSNGLTDTHCALALQMPALQKEEGSCQWWLGLLVVPTATECRSEAAATVRT